MYSQSSETHSERTSPALRSSRLLTCSLLLTLIACGSVAQRASAWGIVWSDEFTGASSGAQPYSGFWNFETGSGPNNEIEHYVTSWANCHVVYDGTGTDGQALRIEAQTDTGNQYGQWYSARINSAGKHTFGPGSYIEYRCKFPNSGKAYWPAAWALGTNYGSVGWPACGEIDIAEEINGQWENHQSLHMPGWDPTVVWTVSQSTTTYHNYGAWWPSDGNSITFNMDGSNSATFTRGGGGTWEFGTGKTCFLIINLAIGGNWPGNPDGSTKVNGNFYVDYVRHYM
jgi:beta-glucanase (GH16 family)